MIYTNAKDFFSLFYGVVRRVGRKCSPATRCVGWAVSQGLVWGELEDVPPPLIPSLLGGDAIDHLSQMVFQANVASRSSSLLLLFIGRVMESEYLRLCRVQCKE